MTGTAALPGAGVMMYTVLEQARADLEGTLARLAAIGYRGIETYGLVEHFGRPGSAGPSTPRAWC